MDGRGQRLNAATLAQVTDTATPATLDDGLVIEVEPARFEEMVVTALDGLPPNSAA